ncbi:MAG: FecR domain-containing protein [Magnetococcales bacterium]|nr:FecR domain-containing protein [Magnetococcales bacterium]
MAIVNHEITRSLLFQDGAPSEQTVTFSGNIVNLPDVHFLLEGEYHRSGADLIVENPQGDRIVVTDYFNGGTSPYLVASNGAVVTPAMVQHLLVAEAPVVMVAGPDNWPIPPVGPTIGTVDRIVGKVLARGQDGQVRILAKGDAIYQGDVIKSSAGAQVKFVFSDGTTFQIGENARGILDEYLFNPSAAQGQFGVTVMTGIFRYTSGQIATLNKNAQHSTIKTPVAVVGIRGSAVDGEVTSSGETKVVLDHGNVTVSDPMGQGSITLAPGVGASIPASGGPPKPFVPPPSFTNRLQSQLSPQSFEQKEKHEQQQQQHKEQESRGTESRSESLEGVTKAADEQKGDKQPAAQASGDTGNQKIVEKLIKEGDDTTKDAEKDKPSIEPEKVQDASGSEVVDAVVDKVEEELEKIEVKVEQQKEEMSAQSEEQGKALEEEKTQEEEAQEETVEIDPAVAALAALEAARVKAATPPVVVGFAKQGVEVSESGDPASPPVTVTFSKDDFKDATSAPLSTGTVRISALPDATKEGVLSLSGTAVTAGQSVPVDKLDQLVFKPVQDWNGSTTIQWQASSPDGDHYSDAAAITVTIAATNDAPTLITGTISGTENQSLALTAAMFTSRFKDVDGDALATVRITGLPDHGVLNLNGQPVTLDQEIAASELGNLQFVPNEGEYWSGSTDLTWQGSDGTVYSNEATMVLAIDRTSPSLDYALLETVGGRENGTITLTEAMLANQPNATADEKMDPDTPASQVIYTLASLPGYGDLLLNNTQLTEASTFTLDDVKNGRVSYRHGGSEDYQDSFSFTVMDEHGSTTATDVTDFAITVTPVNDAPQMTAATVALSSRTFEVSDLLGSVTDSEGDAIGVAVTRLDNSQGNWQFSLDGENWQAFGTPSSSAATLLDDSDWIRFEPRTGASGRASIDFVAWDHTTGEHGDTGINTTTGSGNAFSNTTATASVASSDSTPSAAIPTFQEVFSSTHEEIKIPSSSSSSSASTISPYVDDTTTATSAPPLLPLSHLLPDEQQHAMMV